MRYPQRMLQGWILGIILLGLNTANARPDWKKYNLVNGCLVFNAKGETLKELPGLFCQFYDDGNLLTASQFSLRMMDKFKAVKWELKGNFHHQLNKSADGSRILVLDSHQADGIRVETFYILSRDGKVEFKNDSTSLKKQVKFKPHSKNQLTHLNSFYEIPELKTNRKLPAYLQAGNFILNTYRSGTFILSPDLKTVLHHFSLPAPSTHLVHDVQVLENGNILLFNNTASKTENDKPFSAIEEWDMVENKKVLDFTAQPRELFFSLFCGGVQQLDQEHLLFSHMLTGTYIYSRKNKEIIFSTVKTHFRREVFHPAQQVKAMDLTKFLTHW